MGHLHLHTCPMTTCCSHIPVFTYTCACSYLQELLPVPHYLPYVCGITCPLVPLVGCPLPAPCHHYHTHIHLPPSPHSHTPYHTCPSPHLFAPDTSASPASRTTDSFLGYITLYLYYCPLDLPSLPTYLVISPFTPPVLPTAFLPHRAPWDLGFTHTHTPAFNMIAWLIIPHTTVWIG